MDKILMSVLVPSIGEKYDVYVPDFLPIGQVAKLMGKAVEELSSGRYISSGQEFLCSVKREQVLSESSTLADYGIVNGEVVMLY